MLSASWLLLLTCLSQAGTPDVVKELRAYYQVSDKAPAYGATIAKLASADRKERTEALAWLRALLVQALTDKQSDAAP